MLSNHSTPTWLACKNPLIIASSGGNGHISAALSLIQQLSQEQKHLKNYYIHKPKNKKLSIETFVWGALYFLNIPLIQKISSLPQKYYIPSPFQLKKEKSLLLKQQASYQQRPYVDYLLDLLPNGYVYTAIFNLLQSQGHSQSLNTVTKGQPFLDKLYKKTISQKILKLFEQAIAEGHPYDCIISTQAMGLSAMCHAAYTYNQNIKTLEKKYQQKLSSIHIHQFITDIPKACALHFLNPLQKLKPYEKNVLSIHLLELDDKNIFAEQELAKDFYFYSPEHHPIIRPELRKKNYFHDILGFNWIRVGQQMITRLPHQKLAVLMFSSGTGDISLEYLQKIMQNHIKHIALIGKTNPKIQEAIHQIQTQSDCKIYLLGHLQAKDLRKVLNAAHLLVVKGGGLSLMELASFSLRPDCRIFIHHPQASQNPENAKGLVWEDGNIQWFLDYCQKNHKKAYLTHPQKIADHLSVF